MVPFTHAMLIGPSGEQEPEKPRLHSFTLVSFPAQGKMLRVHGLLAGPNAPLGSSRPLPA